MSVVYHIKTGKRRSGALDKAFKNDKLYNFKSVLRNLHCTTKGRSFLEYFVKS